MDALSVSEAARLIKQALSDASSLKGICVRGEISNYSQKTHHYFTVKDGTALLKCVIWSSRASKLNATILRDGVTVKLTGDVTTYPMASLYQLDVHDVVLDGAGELQQKFLELRKKLESEGLFAPERKRKIPLFPEKVGIVTSATGAALQDMQKVFSTGPGLELVIVDSKVQGESAALDIAQGIRKLDGKVDVIIIGRGGGSYEDLWAFNEEVLARAVYACGTPVISAVGHEVDEVLTDFVADCRAPTPTAAANLIVNSMNEVIKERQSLKDRIDLAIESRLNALRQRVEMEISSIQRNVMVSRIQCAVHQKRSIDASISLLMTEKLACARQSYAEGSTALRTTWIAAIEEKGLTAVFQDNVRRVSIQELREGPFKGILKGGAIAGVIEDVEVRKDDGKA